MKCEVEGCSKKIHRKKYCCTHHRRWQQYGNVYASIPLGSGSRLSLPMQKKVLQAKFGYRYCQWCNKYKKAKEFGIGRAQCRRCRRNRELKKNYNINNKDYDKLLKKQKGRCALCRTKKPGGKDNVFQIDHNHKTGKIRGLLCNSCNLGIGMLEFNKVPIARLIKYLKK